MYMQVTPNRDIETVIIVAGGKGERMQTDIPKQFIELKSRPILMHTIDVFIQYNTQIDVIVVLPETQIENWSLLCKKHAFETKHRVIAGGSVRFESVKNGLKVASDSGFVAVHDGVRPLVSQTTIKACFREARISGAAIPVVMSVESIRQIKGDENVAVDRDLFRLVQTPQVFEANILKKAYEQEFNSLFTDDASVVEASGVKISLVEGNCENIKITTPFDLKLAEMMR
jgi:2-C-methyl-D-erythritol 4-phosphate cytidylyltransferase